ncbi:trypsin-like peptidase domain-containing protein [Myceligenerans pegani]|uniref:Trypsin-like peptidase domain-containing protein n=1 Tax=Myceligenerans pegani TaxID=2776917 RepID=A0ABR9MY30_9MICO|nr:trypsin-like peptidase domain-containing protein [Myceligenerans sp. TRM 65318]MBE1876286.1 trypsin-like peptidase domain-containing protein [Myceligenerans sp. TRM 65318]MBE3018557.1 trypsin-like peptidase domain-containing protein [Myceligenerans sp. TRM 65318]
MARGRARGGTVAAVLAAVLLLGACGGPGDDGEPRSRSAETGGTSPESPEPAGQGDLLDRLREGGLTLVIRHAATDRSDPDDAEVDLDDCSTQRNLSDEGRTEAAMIGDGVADLGIPVGAVWASPYCRSRDTAELAFGRAEVVDGLERLYPVRDERADDRLNDRILAEAPRPGEPNLAIVSHGVYPSVLAPGVSIAEGEAAVYARDGDDGFDLIGRLGPREWTESSPDRGRPASAMAEVSGSVVAVRAPGGTGSAFRVAVPGILVTSAQVVDGADEVAVRLPDGTELVARVLGRRPDVDIAALRVDDDSALPALHSGSGLADARPGDRVHAVGADGDVTTGTVRDLDSSVRAGGTERPVIRLDRRAPRAATGGPLVDEDGYVLGVLTTTPGEPDGLAIPVDVARDAALGLVRDGET